MAVGGFSLVGYQTVSFGSREGAGEGGRRKKINIIFAFLKAFPHSGF